MMKYPTLEPVQPHSCTASLRSDATICAPLKGDGCPVNFTLDKTSGNCIKK